MSKKPSPIEREPVSSKLKMKAKPNWIDLDENEPDTPDRFRISPEIAPEGMSFQWVTDTVIGMQMPQHRANFEKRGWTPVHQEDFDGVLNGLFMPKDKAGEIMQDGMVLMARPKELTERALLRDRRKALEQVAIKEKGLLSGQLAGVTLDATHASAVKSNHITRSFERIEVPTDKD